VLAGCRVIDHGTFITGPYAAMLLADLGAEVIKVERPDGGDPFRNFNDGLYSPQFQAFNRNKQSCAIDLNQADDRALLARMIDDADVYIQNFRPGVADRFGFAPAQVRTRNPRLVYCSISGFGDDGPYVKRPAYDTVAQALSGYLSMFIHPEDPHVIGPAVADGITGLYAAYGVLGALYERQATGKGRLVEVSMVEAMMHFSVEQFTHYFATGRTPGPFDRSRLAQSYALICADGKLIVLHLSSLDKFWDALVEAIERPDLAKDPRFATRMDRVGNQATLREALLSIFRGRSRLEWMSRLEKADVPHAPVYNLEETLIDPQVRHLGVERSLSHPTEGALRTIRRPVIYDGDRDGIEMTPPPVLDEQGPVIRAAMGEAPATRRNAGARKSGNGHGRQQSGDVADAF
jgi:crotonobetainyl-CoA:carnitine CoA-transferase CaiB-like acyl-CoA transferase